MTAINLSQYQQHEISINSQAYLSTVAYLLIKNLSQNKCKEFSAAGALSKERRALKLLGLIFAVRFMIKTSP